uniref:Uncharacterized protein n=1 Tax=Arundo donax TaxID=35708 RepID=A0A0A9AMT6_ARUDO
MTSDSTRARHIIHTAKSSL